MSLGKVLKFPLKIFKLPKKGVDKVVKNIYSQLALMILRHALTAIGVGGVLTNDDITQVVGAAATVVGLSWSAWRKIQAAKSQSSADQP